MLQPSFIYSPAQHDVADLLLAVRVLPLESVVTNVLDILKEAAGKAGKPQTQIDKVGVAIPFLSLYSPLHFPG